MLTALTVLNVLALLLGAAWPVVRLSAVFLFDAPGSDRYVTVWAAAFTAWYVWPVPPVVGNGLFWIYRTHVALPTLAAFTVVSLSGALVLALCLGAFGIERNLRGR